MLDRNDILRGSAAIASLEVAKRRGLTLPKPLTMAQEVIQRLDALSRSVDPSLPELPNDPDKLDRVLADGATRRVKAAAVREIAAELRPQAIERSNSEVIAAAANWVTELCKEFKDQAKILREVAITAPRVGADQISHLAPAEFESWSRATNSVLSLEQLASDRGTFASLLNENHSSHWGGVLPIIAVVSPPSGDSEKVSNGFRTRIAIKECMSIDDATTKWYSLLQLESRGWMTLSLAPAFGLAARVELINAWPRSFESLMFRDNGATTASTMASAGEIWKSLTAA